MPLETVAGRRVEINEVEIEPIRVRVLPDGRMDRENAAKYIGVRPKTLAQWDMEGRGPESLLIGGRRFYYRERLDEFIRSKAA